MPVNATVKAKKEEVKKGMSFDIAAVCEIGVVIAAIALGIGYEIGKHSCQDDPDKKKEQNAESEE
jgi:hypothetical protein